MSRYLSISAGVTWKAITIISLFVTGAGLLLFAGRMYFNLNVQTIVPAVLESENRVISSGSSRASAFGLPSHCDAFDLSNIAISIKTGATVIFERLPTQLLTSLGCVSNPLIFSDLDQTLGSYQVHDVLSRVSPAATANNPDFDLYFKLNECMSQGRETDLKSLSSLTIPTEDWRTDGKSAAWALDKYKFLHMVERAWELQPNLDWYVFLEGDTYLSVPTLLRWLGTQAPKQKLYLGNSVLMYEHPDHLHFAHGGSGFVLSGAAVKDFAVTHKGVANRFDGRARGWWYGDFNLADALDQELDLHVTDVTPMMSGDEPALIPFGEIIWCTPVITLHHMDLKMFDDMYKFEKSRNFSGLLFRDVYAAMYTAGLPTKREAWDNLSDDGRFAIEVVPNNAERLPEKADGMNFEDPLRSYEACEMACIRNKACFQFTFISRTTIKDDGSVGPSTECRLTSTFRLGRAVDLSEHEQGTQFDSGWLSDRINEWVDKHQDCSSGADG